MRKSRIDKTLRQCLARFNKPRRRIYWDHRWNRCWLEWSRHRKRVIYLWTTDPQTTDGLYRGLNIRGEVSVVTRLYLSPKWSVKHCDEPEHCQYSRISPYNMTVIFHSLHPSYVYYFMLSEPTDKDSQVSLDKIPRTVDSWMSNYGVSG